MSRKSFQGRRGNNPYTPKTSYRSRVPVPVKKPINLGLIITFLIIAGLAESLPVFLTLLIGYGVYRQIKGRKQAAEDRIAGRLQELKDKIARTDRQVKLLDQHLANQDISQYRLLAQPVLDQISDIQWETQNLKNNMDANIYKRVLKKADTLKLDIQTQLDDIALNQKSYEASQEEAHIRKNASEILTTYQNIQRDHAAVLDRLQKSHNSAELTAIHETNMERFRDILEGYLKIKTNPNSYHNAQDRLDLAKQAMEQFDLDLDQTLRELNESDLADFEVSLRMMTQKTKNL